MPDSKEPSTTTKSLDAEDLKLKRGLGFWSLLATGLGSVIGSGWLLSAMFAAQSAGPASIIAWIIAGILMLMLALVFAELGMVRPESGGLVRYPLYSNGRLAASIVGWSMWVGYVGNPPTEAAATVQYLSKLMPFLYEGEKLTLWGILAAVLLMAIFVVINYFGVKVFASTNNIVTAIKVFIPTITVVMLIISGFDGSNMSGHGGFAPYGIGAAFSTIATAGLVYAYTGFRNIVELSGEAKNPRRNIPLALIVTILFTIVLYLGLQIAYLGAVPGNMLDKAGWHGVNFNSPFAQIAAMLGLMWLSWLLLADSAFSPSGSAIVYTAANSRNVYGLAKNRFFPHWFAKINRGGVPGRALMLNFFIGILFLLPLPSWHAIVGVTSTLAVFTFSIGSITLVVFRRMNVGHQKDRLPGMKIISPIAFVVSALVMLWVPWDQLWLTIPIVAVGLVWYLVTLFKDKHPLIEVHAGLWLIVDLVFVYVMSALASAGIVPEPWATIIVAVGAFAIYFWGVKSGVDFMRSEPEMVEQLKTGQIDLDEVDELSETSGANPETPRA